MTTAIDSSVLLDLLGDFVSADAERAAAALEKAAREGALIVSESVIAEISPYIGSPGIAEFLADRHIEFIPSTLEAARLAGEMYALYLEHGGRRGRVVPDFLIGAHAILLADRLLARDRGYRRDYFRDLKLIEP